MPGEDRRASWRATDESPADARIACHSTPRGRPHGRVRPEPLAQRCGGHEPRLVGHQLDDRARAEAATRGHLTEVREHGSDAGDRRLRASREEGEATGPRAVDGAGHGSVNDRHAGRRPRGQLEEQSTRLVVRSTHTAPPRSAAASLLTAELIHLEERYRPRFDLVTVVPPPRSRGPRRTVPDPTTTPWSSRRPSTGRGGTGTGAPRGAAARRRPARRGRRAGAADDPAIRPAAPPRSRVVSRGGAVRLAARRGGMRPGDAGAAAHVGGQRPMRRAAMA